jgi:hypothetical protein
MAVFTAVGLLGSLVLSVDTEAVEQRNVTTMRHLVARAGFELAIGNWNEVNQSTRLSRVVGGHGSAHAARLRAPRSHRATIGMTDAPSMVSHTSRGQVYRARVWLKATPRAVRQSNLTARIQLAQQSHGHQHVVTWRRIHLSKTSWRSVTVWLTARADGHRLGVTIRAFDVRADAAVKVDNVTVHKVAKPHVKASALRGTRYGASVDAGSTDWTKALHQSDGRYSRLDVVRFYDPDFPDSWHSSRLNSVNRPIVYSFAAQPSAVLSGKHDKQLRRWFKAAPSRWPIWWSYRQEPEDDIARGDYSASRYRQAWRHINQLARTADNHRLHPTLILMCWTASPNSGRRFSNYYPGDFIQVLGWDCYNTDTQDTRYKPARQIMHYAVARARRMHKGFGVSEVGSRLLPGDDGSRRAMWLAGVARYTGHRNAAFVSYWDANIPAGNFKLRDMPSRRAWHDVVSK